MCKRNRGNSHQRTLAANRALISKRCPRKSSRVRNTLGTKELPPVEAAFPEHRGAGPGLRTGRAKNSLRGWVWRRAVSGSGWLPTMLSVACSRLTSTLRSTRALPSAVARRCLRGSGSQRLADQSERIEDAPRAFDPALLEFLVCPLSKKPLRYEASTNELINEELGIAYPIIDGIPNMIPQAARMIHQNKKAEDMEQH